ncbi:uncharacterized protein BDR25DRAFT_363216 [Lindgomyces ingoldianus]|uniref:Uncharacterized protein n=1 Tax=Lindgomyces ingoldianus TaxID=673940 RepID=A0ACB6Q7Q1_9PLEO|nr:uncharacterized protein BDR25DRAFT_363216 [Lindgomyces ingoldianus]KAF2463019.1 hypothetical protein BDR25DRAFT_363216 [Lindgomyces ingoldianus]
MSQQGNGSRFKSGAETHRKKVGAKPRDKSLHGPRYVIKPIRVSDTNNDISFNNPLISLTSPKGRKGKALEPSVDTKTFFSNRDLGNILSFTHHDLLDHIVRYVIQQLDLVEVGKYILVKSCVDHGVQQARSSMEVDLPDIFQLEIAEQSGDKRERVDERSALRGSSNRANEPSLAARHLLLHFLPILVILISLQVVQNGYVVAGSRASASGFTTSKSTLKISDSDVAAPLSLDRKLMGPVTFGKPAAPSGRAPCAKSYDHATIPVALPPAYLRCRILVRRTLKSAVCTDNVRRRLLAGLGDHVRVGNMIDTPRRIRATIVKKGLTEELTELTLVFSRPQLAGLEADVIGAIMAQIGVSLYEFPGLKVVDHAALGNTVMSTPRELEDSAETGAETGELVLPELPKEPIHRDDHLVSNFRRYSKANPRVISLEQKSSSATPEHKCEASLTMAERRHIRIAKREGRRTEYIVGNTHSKLYSVIVAKELKVVKASMRADGLPTSHFLYRRRGDIFLSYYQSTRPPKVYGSFTFTLMLARHDPLCKCNVALVAGIGLSFLLKTTKMLVELVNGFSNAWRRRVHTRQEIADQKLPYCIPDNPHNKVREHHHRIWDFPERATLGSFNALIILNGGGIAQSIISCTHLPPFSTTTTMIKPYPNISTDKHFYFRNIIIMASGLLLSLLSFCHLLRIAPYSHIADLDYALIFLIHY